MPVCWQSISSAGVLIWRFRASVTLVTNTGHFDYSCPTGSISRPHRSALYDAKCSLNCARLGCSCRSVLELPYHRIVSQTIERNNPRYQDHAALYGDLRLSTAEVFLEEPHVTLSLSYTLFDDTGTFSCLQQRKMQQLLPSRKGQKPSSLCSFVARHGRAADTTSPPLPCRCLRVENSQRHFRAHKGRQITALRVSPNGRFVASGEAGTRPVVRVWDAATSVEVGHCSHTRLSYY